MMVYCTEVIPISWSDLQPHLPIAAFSNAIFRAATDKILTDSESRGASAIAGLLVYQLQTTSG